MPSSYSSLAAAQPRPHEVHTLTMWSTMVCSERSGVQCIGCWNLAVENVGSPSVCVCVCVREGTMSAAKRRVWCPFSTPHYLCQACQPIHSSCIASCVSWSGGRTLRSQTHRLAQLSSSLHTPLTHSHTLYCCAILKRRWTPLDASKRAEGAIDPTPYLLRTHVPHGHTRPRMHSISLQHVVF